MDYFKVFIECITRLPLFYVFWFSGQQARGILAPWPGIVLSPPALEGKILTTGPPGKSQQFIFFFFPAIYFLNRNQLGYLFAACGEHTIWSRLEWSQGFGLYWVSTSRGQWGRAIPSKNCHEKHQKIVLHTAWCQMFYFGALKYFRGRMF